MDEHNLKHLVRTMIDDALTENAMVKMPKREAIVMLRSRWKQLNNHIVKIAMWGDSSGWRKEIKAFSTSLQNTKLKLKRDRHFTREEHEDALEDFRNTRDGKMYFRSKFQEMTDEMNVAKPKRSIEEGQQIAYELQKAFINALIQRQVEWGNVDTIIDSVLNKYPKINAQPYVY